MFKEEVKGSLYIALKDLRMYYFKPPNLTVVPQVKDLSVCNVF
jgi:hypothetical protein